MAGGTAFYFSNAVSRLEVQYKLVTALAPVDMPSVDDLRAKGIDVTVLPSAHTVFFENIYSGNQDHRTQRVVRQADPFTAKQLQDIDAQTALQRGVVNEVVPHAQALARGVEIATKLAAKPAFYGTAQKQTLNQRLRRRVVEGVPYGMALEGLTAANLAYPQNA